MVENQQCAISVRNVCFEYEQYSRSELVLNCANLTVSKGEIYGLLGPSGCGKTTLLKAIIGLLQPRRGEVSVFGYTPGSRESGTPGIGVGYMPQEISLPMLFTISEVFQYFGKIYLLNNEFIETQMKHFSNAFRLNDVNEMISNLSGGQQRRVSLAIALFSFPRLLILDEPTVGVDPLLRRSIWSFLTQLVEQRNTTIIVTTHYIEEMRCAKTVALMRNGEILVENDPNYIILENNSLTLEDAFLKLCTEHKKVKKVRKLSQQRLSVISNDFLVRKSNFGQTINEPLNEKRSTSLFYNDMNILRAIVCKILKTYVRHGGPFFAFCLPILALVITILGVGMRPKDVRLGCVVDDIVPLTSNEDFADTPFLPDLFITCLNSSNMFEVVKYNTTSDAMGAAKKRKIVGFVHLKKNFSEAFYERELFLNYDNDFVSNDTIDAGSIHFYGDVTIKPLFDFYEHELLDIIWEFREEAYEAIGVNRNVSLNSFQIGEAIHESPEWGDYSAHTHNTSVAVYTLVYFGFSVAAIAITLLLDNNDEMYSRMFSAGVKAYHLLFAEIFTQFMLMSLSVITSFLIMVYVLQVSCRGSYFLAVFNVLLELLSALSLGAVFAVTIKTPFNCHLFCYAIFINVLPFSDGVWPTIASPYFIKLLLPFSPVYFQTLASLKIFNYASFNFVSDILPSFACSICYTFISCLLACLILQRNR